MKHDRIIILSPPIESIERQHLGLSDQLIERVLEGDLPPKVKEAAQAHPDWEAYSALPEPSPLAEPPASLPPAVEEAIHRLSQAAAAHFDAPPRPGQIVEIAELPRHYEERMGGALGAPLYVLLDGPDTGTDPERLWWGWMCAPEVDYASWWDMVLQEEDEPAFPEAGMVQVWNPVHVPKALMGRVVAQLSPERLQAVRALTRDYLLGASPEDVPARPGHVAMRKVDGLPVVTGTPLGEEDVRHRYQHIYLQAAEALRGASRFTLEEAPEAAVDLTRWFANLWQGLAGILVPEEAVPVAMDVGEAGRDLRWPETGLRLHAQGDALFLSNEGDRSVEVRLLDPEGQLLDRHLLEPGQQLAIDLEDPELASLRLTCGNEHLELPL